MYLNLLFDKMSKTKEIKLGNSVSYKTLEKEKETTLAFLILFFIGD